jgi:hypothetical protein
LCSIDVVLDGGVCASIMKPECGKTVDSIVDSGNTTDGNAGGDGV